MTTRPGCRSEEREKYNQVGEAIKEYVQCKVGFFVEVNRVLNRDLAEKVAENEGLKRDNLYLTKVLSERVMEIEDLTKTMLRLKGEIDDKVAENERLATRNLLLNGRFAECHRIINVLFKTLKTTVTKVHSERIVEIEDLMKNMFRLKIFIFLLFVVIAIVVARY